MTSPCDELQDLLPAFHDGELAIEQQIAVEQHLDGCHLCRWELQRLQAIGSGLRSAALAVHDGNAPRVDLEPRVLSRLEAEQHESLPAALGRMFEDMHLVWAVVGAGFATSLCVAVAFAVLSFGSPGRADSLAGILSVLSSPGSNENPVRLDARIHMPRVSSEQAMPVVLIERGSGLDDELFALGAVLTREGRLVDLEVLLTRDRSPQDLLKLLDAASTARFEPARFAGSPVAVNMVWLLAHTTVRGKLMS